MKLYRTRILLVGALFAFVVSAYSSCACAQMDKTERAEAAPLTAEQQEKLKERYRYGKQAQELRRQGKLEQAIAAAEKMLAIEREMYGDVHEDVAGSLERLAEMHEESEAWDAARQAREEVLDIKTKLFGNDHYKVTDARLALANLERIARLTNKQRQELSRVDELEDQAGRYTRRASTSRQSLWPCR